MKITVLTANRSAVAGVKKNKGQSFLIQTENHNFLFGFGSDKTVLRNMRKLGVSPDIVDTAFLSCGNNEQSGGLLPFLAENRRASVYARVNAFNARYKKGALGMRDVSPDKKLRSKRRILRCKNYFVSKDDDFAAFSFPESPENRSPANAAYFVRNEDGTFAPDDFSHEMYLLVREDKRWALFCGDAHAGVVSAVERAQNLVRRNLGGKLEWVVGGFNLTAGNGKPVSDEYIDGVASALSGTDVSYYTGHSTGARAFARLQAVLGGKIRSYAAGDVFEF